MFKVHILGCSSATPTRRHTPSCQIVDYRGNLMMVDCGEGAQRQMRIQGLKFSRLRHIFISHLHGDHIFGLPGLLSTMALHEKGGRLTIHTFAEGIQLLKPMMDFFCGETPFEIEWSEVRPGERYTIVDMPSLSVETIPLDHRVPCTGYLFREKPKERHLNGELARFFNIPVRDLAAIKAGADWVRPETGEVIANARLTTPADPSLAYAYCSDTRPSDKVVDAVSGVNLLYHEATYGDDNKELAWPRGHSTAREAGEIARRAGVDRLVIGHYSKRYRDERILVEQAAEAFGGEVIAANEGMIIDV